MGTDDEAESKLEGKREDGNTQYSHRVRQIKKAMRSGKKWEKAKAISTECQNR
jgi:hypothetical protein